MKNETLSDKIRDLYEHEKEEQQSILVKDVREFIKNLKELVLANSIVPEDPRIYVKKLNEIIDKLAGEKLT